VPSGFSYPSSWTDIANQALGRLGSKLINNLLDGSALAGYCQQFMGKAVEDVLNEADWTSAIKRTSLVQTVDTPPFGYAYYYQMPGDFHRLVEGGGIETTGEDYSIEGDKLLTDAAEVNIAYVARPEESATLAPHIRGAIALRLAFLLTTPLTSSEPLAARIAAEYAEAIKVALSADGARKRTATLSDENGCIWYDELR
jgi:hypothetical protein